MCLLVRELLSQGRIAISEHFTSNELTPLSAKKQIADELTCYAVVTEPPKTTFGKVSRGRRAGGEAVRVAPRQPCETAR